MQEEHAEQFIRDRFEKRLDAMKVRVTNVVTAAAATAGVAAAAAPLVAVLVAVFMQGVQQSPL
jgi:hypothetical protein